MATRTTNEGSRSGPSGRERGGEALQVAAVPSGAAASGGASSELLSSVARSLHELEGAAGAAASELRRRVEGIGAPGSPKGSANEVAHAVLRELLQTLGERADGIEHEAELIAGILERAREQLERARLESAPAAQALASVQTEAHAGDPAPEKGTPQAQPSGVASHKRRRRVVARRSPERAPDPERSAATVEDEDEAMQPAAARPEGSPDVVATNTRNGDAPEGVKLLAVQMALAGTRTEEIAARLRREFGVVDPAPAVEQVLGGWSPH